MNIRKPVVAGQFYPAQNSACIKEIAEYLDQITLPDSLPESIVAGIVPHAGWLFSGSLALAVFAAIQQQHKKVNTFIIFGAAHAYYGDIPAVFSTGHWLTPLGEIAINEDLAEQLLATGKAVSDTSAHAREHSIEVQVPFIQHLFPGSKILPIVTPPNDSAIPLGQAVAALIGKNSDQKIVCIGSTDLTHYGPHYGFETMGQGPDAFDWASGVNDKKFIDAALALNPAAMLETTLENHNACGPGAAAAAVAAAKKLGKKNGILLAQTNSDTVMRQKLNSTSTDSVGYAAIVF